MCRSYETKIPDSNIKWEINFERIKTPKRIYLDEYEKIDSTLITK